MSRRAQAHIRTAALKHNLARVRAYAPESRVMAAIKADGYGHGALQVAAALDDADALAVATLNEAMQLRWHGEQRDIVILSGLNRAEDFFTAAEQGIQVVIHDPQHLACLGALDAAQPLGVWLKLDTGMHRLGFPAAQAAELLAHLQALPNLVVMGIVSHFACADDPDSPLTSEQIKCFQRATQGLHTAGSLANSAAIVSRTDSHADWVRPGIMLYGGCPVLGKTAQDYDLQPAMS
ncbi:MAG: alanine racemase, partial [Nevskiales bacterium]